MRYGLAATQLHPQVYLQIAVIHRYFVTQWVQCVCLYRTSYDVKACYDEALRFYSKHYKTQIPSLCGR